MFAAIVISDFALQAALRHEPELRTRPVILLAEKASKAPILQSTAAARALGIVPGLTATQAQTRCPGVLAKLRSPTAERTTTATLLEAAFSASPFVEDTAPGVCTIELKSTRAPDPRELSQKLRAHFAALHLDAQLGFAPTADLALLAAQSTSDWLAIRCASELADLPVAALDPSPTLLCIFEKWGIRTLRELVALGRSALVERLGAEALPLHARATGRVERPLRCLPPPEIFEESIEFEQEIETLEPLLFILRRFIEALAQRLENVWLVAAELTLRLTLADGTETERTFKIPSPTSQVPVLFGMLETHLEKFTAAHPIIRLHLDATPARGARQQFGLFESALRDPNQLYETLARLTALVGDDRVGVPILDPTHRPDAFRLIPANFTAPPCAADAAALPLGLALRRFRPPIPASVQMKGRPISLQTATLRGPITAAHGPMLLSGDWWEGRTWSRAEWDVQIEGGPLCRIYEQEGAWAVEGVYD